MNGFGENQKPIKKTKDGKSSVVKATITFDDSIKCLRKYVIVTQEQRNIRSRHLHTEKEKKIALSPHDDKRCLQPSTSDTLPWGHYKIVIEAASNEEASREEEIELPNTAEEVAVGSLYKEAV